MRTFGQAIDAAVTQHLQLYPDSDVYEASVIESSTRDQQYKVELCALHFSVPCAYYVPFRGAL